eukprot:SAG11_NODE_787_length_7169_cov_4.571146_3_plen_52_part_00
MLARGPLYNNLIALFLRLMSQYIHVSLCRYVRRNDLYVRINELHEFVCKSQ